MLPEGRNIPTVNNLIVPVARGSVLHKQLQECQVASTNPVTSCDPISYQSPNPAMNGSGNESGHVPTQPNSNVSDGHFTNNSENSTDIQPRHTPMQQECLNNSFPSQGFTTFPLLPNKCCEETVDLNLFFNAPNILSKVQVFLQAVQELYTKTTGQANNSVCYKETRHRITVPKFGKILKRKSQPTPELIRAIYHLVDISNLLFVKYDRENEAKVADIYVKKMHEEGNTGLRVAEVGLCVNPSLPHLGASLDHIVFDPISNDEVWRLHFTCPLAPSWRIGPHKFGGVEIKTKKSQR